jgi:antitoxin PrlF
MPKKKEMSSSCCSGKSGAGSYRVESIVSVDNRGQMVLPKELRTKMDLKVNDKLAVISFPDDSGCLLLLKSENLEQTLKNLLDPIIAKQKK